MRNSTHRRRRSRSKDRRKSVIAARKTSVFAFGVGASLAVFLWVRLQADGVPGPWAKAVGSQASGREERLESLRSRRQNLIAQIAIVDSQLAGGPSANSANNLKISNHDGLPTDDGGARDGAREEGKSAFERGWQQQTVQEDFEGGGAGDGYGAGAGGVGVAAEGHFILGLSNEAFGSTPVDEMMAQYDTEACDTSFGNGLVDAWRQTGTECCGGSPDGGFGGLIRGGSTSSSSSSIRCHLMKQDNHRGNGDNLVHMTNVQLNLEGLTDRRAAKKVMQTYKNSRHEKQAYMPLELGNVKGTCAPRAPSWRKENFPGWNADWTTSAFQTVDQLQCDRWVDHPVMVVQRDTFANLFHDSEDFVNAFLAMAILRKRPAEVQVLLTDLYPQGPFWPMWDKVFGVGRPTLTAWDVGLQYGDGKVCFRDLTIGIYGPAAPTTLARMVTPCFNTALVRAYADFVIRGLGLQELTSYAYPPSKKVVVTWMARRSSVQWPEAAYCSEDGKGSFFTCDYFTHLDTRELQRRVKNEAEVVRSLKQLESETFANGAEVEVRDLDYNLLSWEDQIKNDLETDVMVGPHGAGLFHIIFAPDRAHLIELQIDQTTARKHFNNLAKWSGRLYTARGGRNPVDVGGTQSMVRNAIDGMDLSRH
eukprot:g16911.t1